MKKSKITAFLEDTKDFLTSRESLPAYAGGGAVGTAYEIIYNLQHVTESEVIYEGGKEVASNVVNSYWTLQPRLSNPVGMVLAAAVPFIFVVGAAVVGRNIRKYLDKRELQ